MKADNIDTSIKYLENRLKTLNRIKELLKRLEKNDDTRKIVVSDESSSIAINIIIVTNRVSEDLAELSELGTLSKDDIIYDYENDQYRLNKNIKLITNT